jgi:hypothetical protein
MGETPMRLRNCTPRKLNGENNTDVATIGARYRAAVQGASAAAPRCGRAGRQGRPRFEMNTSM